MVENSVQDSYENLFCEQRFRIRWDTPESIVSRPWSRDFGSLIFALWSLTLFFQIVPGRILTFSESIFFLRPKGDDDDDDDGSISGAPFPLPGGGTLEDAEGRANPAWLVCSYSVSIATSCVNPDCSTYCLQWLWIWIINNLLTS